MKKLITFLLFLLMASAGLAQKTLLFEKAGTKTRYGYHLGDNIKVRTIKQDLLLKSYLWGITDSTVTIGPRTTIQINDIGAFYRQNYFPKLATKLLFIAGAGYLVIDSFNNLINNQQVFLPQTLIISGALIGVSLALIPLHQSKHKIGISWKVKVLEGEIKVE